MKSLHSLLILTLILTLLFATPASAEAPTLNWLTKTEKIDGHCESNDFRYVFSITKSFDNEPTRDKPTGRGYGDLTIYDKIYVGNDIYFSDLNLIEFKGSMNHGEATIDVDGKLLVVEWTAEGPTQVTREEQTKDYHGVATWYVSDSRRFKSQGLCTVYYDGDVAEGELTKAELWIQQIHIVPIL